jgi:hypothetical protein
VTRADEILELALAPLVSMLNKRSDPSEEWVPQVNLYSKKGVRVCALTGGFPDDPIEGLEQFGRNLSFEKDIDGVVVIAESVDDELMCSAADCEWNMALAIVARKKDKWVVARKTSASDLRVKADRFPAVAVLRGMKSKRT